MDVSFLGVLNGRRRSVVNPLGSMTVAGLRSHVAHGGTFIHI